MTHYFSGVPPGDMPERNQQIEFVVDFWNSVRTIDNPGATTWEVLENLERRVTDCLHEKPQNIELAVRLTAQAMLQMTGQNSF